MTEILDFLSQSPAFYVATVDENNNPRVRPFSFVMEWEGKLTFVTNTQKKIYQQLGQHPYIEICSFSPEKGEWMRISGSVLIFKSKVANAKVLEIMPQLKNIYQSEDNPTLVCFSIIKGEAALYNFAEMNNPVKVIGLSE
jgi:Uncharacterized conserved protein